MTLKTTLLVLLSISFLAYAHKHHHQLSEAEANAPIDAVLWIHIAVQLGVWAILFPIGMVFGITRSRWHVPLQITGFALTAGGYLMGHTHRGRQFPHGSHASFANILLVPLAAQFLLGVYLKLHIHELSFRPMAVQIHGWLGRLYPILGWIQILLGTITLRGDCQANIDQCFGHYITGSGLIAYGIVSAILLASGEAWIEHTGDSPEWWDSWIIVIWGAVYALFAHRGKKWSTSEIQQLALGMLWLTGGALGAFLSRCNQRTVVPAVVLLLTGCTVSAFRQTTETSTEVHKILGFTLILAGLSRIVEICTVPSDDVRKQATITTATGETRSVEKSLRHLTPYFLVAAGLLFMSATDEGLAVVHKYELGHVTYALIIYSLAFALYTHVLVLCHLALKTGRSAKADHMELISNGYAPVLKGEEIHS